MCFSCQGLSFWICDCCYYLDIEYNYETIVMKVEDMQYSKYKIKSLPLPKILKYLQLVAANAGLIVATTVCIVTLWAHDYNFDRLSADLSQLVPPKRAEQCFDSEYAHFVECVCVI